MKGVGPRGGASPYKAFLSAPSPGGGGGGVEHKLHELVLMDSGARKTSSILSNRMGS